ncbi:Pfs, NB-ARC and TPR domain protein [Aspergillus karnatakaensis]|uniref:Pfs, NB-ARC and TPR domain protein n=1 Tax=Aspergillus karnatakaensis TaxID=1810916 RepID=UPI003CCD457E
MSPEPRDFEIAIICALAREFDAVDALFDERYSHASIPKSHGDSNYYQTGRIGTSQVVLACLPEMGKGSAASATASLNSNFPNIRLTLVVGICGGVPFPAENTELFDSGRQYPEQFVRRTGVQDTLDRSDGIVRSVLAGLQTHMKRCQFQATHIEYLRSLQRKEPTLAVPCDTKDCLSVGCAGGLVQRGRLTTKEDPQPDLHFGPIASGDMVMKSARHRDQLARETSVIGFEMEGAGVCGALSCLVIKGVCDYADSHKNKVWQDYAAASAACCAKALLDYLAQADYQRYGSYICTKNLQPSTRMNGNLLFPCWLIVDLTC